MQINLYRYKLKFYDNVILLDCSVISSTFAYQEQERRQEEKAREIELYKRKKLKPVKQVYCISKWCEQLQYPYPVL